MSIDLGEVARRIFEHVMAPLVLGGPMEPGHAVGGRVAFALADPARASAVNADLLDRVQAGRVRRVRSLVPLDAVDLPTPAEWAMSAALHDLFHATNPGFDGVLWRRSAARVLELVSETLGRVAPPSYVGEALSRHSWFARVLDARRTDTAVSWWTGSQVFRGIDPPSRLKLWPELRRVSVVATPHDLLDLAPLAVDRSELAEAVALFLHRTPLTDLATCARSGPAFVWDAATLGLVATLPGRTLALRAMGRAPSLAVDAALGRATRALLGQDRVAADPALSMLAERALATPKRAGERASMPSPDADFARALGAVRALRDLDAAGEAWPPDQRERARRGLEPLVSSDAGKVAMAMVGDTV